MNIPIANAINLLHAVDHAVLATHSAQAPGYPYATVLPFVPDERHRPVLLVSALAEHTKNLISDSRASLLVYEQTNASVLAAARMTLLGRVERIDACAALRAKYVRYQPDAAQYLALADFAFFRLQPLRLRAIAGFGAMGWIEADAFDQTAALKPVQEQELLDRFATVTGAPKLLGVDPYGLDLMHGPRRERRAFPQAPVAPAALLDAVANAIGA